MFLSLFSKKSIYIFGFFVEIEIINKSNNSIVFNGSYLCKDGLVFANKDSSIDFTIADFYDARSYSEISESKKDEVIMEHYSYKLLNFIKKINGDYTLKINKYLIDKEKIRCEKIKDFEVIVETEEFDDFLEGLFEDKLINKIKIGEDDAVVKLNLSKNKFHLLSKNIFEVEIKNNYIEVLNKKISD